MDASAASFPGAPDPRNPSFADNRHGLRIFFPADETSDSADLSVDQRIPLARRTASPMSDVTTPPGPPVDPPKPWYASKTVWLHVLGMLIGLLTFLQTQLSEPAFVVGADGNPEPVSGSILPVVFFIFNVIGIVLRLWTNSPVDFQMIPKGPLALLLALSLVSAAGAAPPKAVIAGPTAGVPGDKITLDASESTGEQFRWIVQPRRAQACRYSTSKDERKLDLNSYAGIYDVTLVCANPEGIDLASCTVTIYSASPPGPLPPEPGPLPVPPGPVPPPGPAPDPNPAPPGPPQPEPQPTPAPPSFPPGQFSISKDVYERAGVVNTATLKADAGAIADALDGVAARIAAGTLTGTVQIVKELQDRIKAGLKGDTSAWLGFSDWINGRVQTLYMSSKLKTAQDWATLLREIALGLRPLAN